MMRSRFTIYITGILLAVCAAVEAQNRANLTPREMFYDPPATPVKQPAPGQPGKATKNAKSPAPGKSTATAAGPAGANSSTAGTATAAGGGTSTSSSPALQNVSVSYTPLGLRYSLLKKSGDEYVEVDVNTTFQSGDSIKLNVESNDDAFLYVINKGTSGSWNVLFPSADIDNGNNHVKARRRVDVPGKGRFTFDDRAGEEGVFVVLSRDVEPDLERLIYSLGKPESQPSRTDSPKSITVQLIKDDVVEKIRRNFTSRDLIFENVNDAAKAEKASYVVNATGGSGGRVIADVSLKHAAKAPGK